MIKKILFIQPFSLLETHFSDVLLVWPFYLENFLKSKLGIMKYDLIYLPCEQKKNKITIKNFSNQEIEAFYSQMDSLIEEVDFLIDHTTLICISCTFSHLYIPTKIIAKYFNELYPSSPIVVGGTHVSVCEMDFMNNEAIDYLIQGDGERSLYELIRNNPHKNTLPKLLPKSFINDLNNTPELDFSSLSIGKYIDQFTQLAINISRGCPFKCYFCIENTLAQERTNPKKWRTYSPKRAVKEVNSMVKYGSEHNIEIYGFVDSIFGFNQKWLESFLDKLNPENASSFWVETRLDILSEKILKKLQKKRFFNWYGLEHTDYEMLINMNKTTNPSRFLEKFWSILEIHKKLNYFCQINLLLLHPGETKRSISHLFNNLEELLMKNYNDLISFNIRRFHNYPGSFISNNIPFFAEKFGTEVHPFSMNWWLNEDLQIQKYGEYCIKPSHRLSIRKGIEIWTDKYKQLIGHEMERLKNHKDRFASIQKAVKYKQESNLLESKRTEFLKFLDFYHIES